MTQPLQDQSVRPLVDRLLACLQQEVALVKNPPKVTCLRPGDQVHLLLSKNDDECCSGLAWVRVVSIYPSSAFPEADAVPPRCGPSAWAALLEMGVARCAPTPTASAIPSCDEWTDLTHAILDDAAAMRRAICCWADLEENRGRLYLPGAWNPLPVDGGCTGGMMQLTVSVPACDCDDVEVS